MNTEQRLDRSDSYVSRSPRRRGLVFKARIERRAFTRSNINAVRDPAMCRRGANWDETGQNRLNWAVCIVPERLDGLQPIRRDKSQQKQELTCLRPRVEDLPLQVRLGHCRNPGLLNPLILGQKLGHRNRVRGCTRRDIKGEFVCVAPCEDTNRQPNRPKGKEAIHQPGFGWMVHSSTEELPQHLPLRRGKLHLTPFHLLS